MTSFYQFLIWFFTIVSLIALMYGVLSADITFIGLFICTLIISVVFHRLNETSPLQESQEQQIKDLTLEGVDKDNKEISQAIETLKQEQTKILTIFKRDIYAIIFKITPRILQWIKIFTCWFFKYRSQRAFPIYNN